MPEPSIKETTCVKYEDIQKRVDNLERELKKLASKIDASSNRRLPTANLSSTDIWIITASIGIIYSILK